jgi:hypothetical protein
MVKGEASPIHANAELVLLSSLIVHLPAFHLKVTFRIGIELFT